MIVTYIQCPHCNLRYMANDIELKNIDMLKIEDDFYIVECPCCFIPYKIIIKITTECI